VIGVSASPSDGTFATGSGDNLVCVWNYGDRPTGHAAASPSLASGEKPRTSGSNSFAPMEGDGSGDGDGGGGGGGGGAPYASARGSRASPSRGDGARGGGEGDLG